MRLPCAAQGFAGALVVNMVSASRHSITGLQERMLLNGALDCQLEQLSRLWHSPSAALALLWLRILYQSDFSVDLRQSPTLPSFEHGAHSQVDSALLSHPAVTEAVSFGAPDEKYGEVVAVIFLAVEAEFQC